jgi:hypothetical protein
MFVLLLVQAEGSLHFQSDRANLHQTLYYQKSLTVMATAAIELVHYAAIPL